MSSTLTGHSTTPLITCADPWTTHHQGPATRPDHHPRPGPDVPHLHRRPPAHLRRHPHHHPLKTHENHPMRC
ncbi:hypothetical protein BQ8420_24080 [Nocardiopsis sp. JB363]|nr:hypothetical protein BQ8420_24080 [Nocardiopsis sp. JB363]